MKVTKVKRRAKGVWTFPDGYRYEWPPYGGELDVLPKHAKVLLALDGFEAVEVEVVDPPLIVPVFFVGEPTPDTIEQPPSVEDPKLDLTGVKVDKVPEKPKAKVEEPLPPPPVLVPEDPKTEPAPALDDPPLDLSGVPVEDVPPVRPAPVPHTATTPLPLADVRKATVRVSHRWSDEDVARAKKEGTL